MLEKYMLLNMDVLSHSLNWDDYRHAKTSAIWSQMKEYLQTEKWSQKVPRVWASLKSHKLVLFSNPFFCLVGPDLEMYSRSIDLDFFLQDAGGRNVWHLAALAGHQRYFSPYGMLETNRDRKHILALTTVDDTWRDLFVSFFTFSFSKHIQLKHQTIAVRCWSHSEACGRTPLHLAATKGQHMVAARWQNESITKSQNFTIWCRPGEYDHLSQKFRLGNVISYTPVDPKQVW